MTTEEQKLVWNMTDDELIDALSAINGSERFQLTIEREALRRILRKLSDVTNFASSHMGETAYDIR